MTPERRLLITGATGFVGKPTAAAACAAGYEVHALSRQSSNEQPNMTWHQCDLLDHRAVRDVVPGIGAHALLHLAWDVTPGQYRDAPANQQWADASAALFESFAANGGRNIVAIGSALEYEGSGVYREDTTALLTSGAYALAKQQTMRALSQVCAQHGLSWSFARVFQAYGPAEHPSRAIPAVARSLLAKRPLQLAASTLVRDLIYVDDVASALCALLQSPVNNAVNIGTGVGSSMRAVFEIMAAQTDGADLLTFSDEQPFNEPAAMIADIGRLRERTAWQPAVQLEDGLRRTLEWWRCQLQ